MSDIDTGLNVWQMTSNHCGGQVKTAIVRTPTGKRFFLTGYR
ncbi:MAG: hypothetical protein O7G88_11305 [bacterium]|nr:hypothetical protein [bacterium]